MNLLIIDDDAICSFVNTRVAQTSGVFRNIHAVHNGQDALEFLQLAESGEVPSPHVILLDLNMPLIDGFDFIKAFNDLSLPAKERIAIVVLTSSDDSKDLERAYALGISHYMQKPLTVNELQATIFLLEKERASK